MDPKTLGELEHENMLEAMSEAAGTAPGSLVRRRNGVVLLASGLAVRLFNQVAIAAATDDSRPIFTGVLTTLGANMMMVAADGFRLGLRSAELEGGLDQEVTLIIPARKSLPASSLRSTRPPRRSNLPPAARPPAGVWPSPAGSRGPRIR